MKSFGKLQREFKPPSKIAQEVFTRERFDPARLMQKFQDGRDFDWDDLGRLLRRTIVVDRERITADCVRGFGFLAELTEDERVLANDRYLREHGLAERLCAGLNELTAV